MIDQYMFLAIISCFWQVSYMILARVSPVSHSVGNCVKRVVVIVSSVLFFRTPVSPVNALGINRSTPTEIHVIPVSKVKDLSSNLINLFYRASGTGIALAGVFLYSRVKGIKSKPKTA